MPTLIQDIRYGSRMLLKNSGFTAVAVLTLALAIGANSALFSVVNAVLLKPLPFQDSSRLVNIRMTEKREANRISSVVSYPDFQDWEAQSRSFSSMTVWDTEDYTLTGQAEPVDLSGTVASANLFSTLGVSPVLGRAFLPSEERPGNSGFAAILSYSTWQGRFGGDPQILGRALTLNGQSFTVIGVMPNGFQFPIQQDHVDLWTTLAPKMVVRDGGTPMTAQRGAHWLRTIARLKPGVTIQQATAGLNVVQSAINKAHPENRPTGIDIIPEKERLVGDVNQALLILFAAVGFVLLIACANLANLLLARSTARQKEISIRAALGAGRMAIVRQLLTESVLLSLIGGACGLLLAFWANGALVNMAAKSLPRAATITLDGTVLAFTAAVTILCGLLFGLAPALQTSKLSISHALNEAGRTGTESGDQGRIRSTLVISEVALALVLLIGSGLLIQSLWKLQRTDPGFRKDQLITFELYLPGSRYQDPQVLAFYRDLMPKLQAIPGVQEASGAFGLPFAPNGATIGFDIARHPVPESERPSADTKIVAPGFFPTMGIPLLNGREFAPQDTLSSTPVLMVNEAFVKKYFRGENPIGQQVKPGIGFGKDAPEEFREVIGVVGDVKGTGDLSAPADPQVYLPTTQGPINDLNVVVRTALPLATILPDLRTQVHSIDHDLPLLGVKTMSDYVDESIAQPKLNTLLLGIFAGLAFILTAIGLYGVISYSVAQRTREMGIRMALGAQRGLILKMILQQGLRLALIGVGAGLCAAFALTRLISSLLYEVRPTDLATFLAVSLLLLGIALFASYVPALRATRIDPVVALRHE
ncbi:MAG TPA: ABC transporter permease [Terriglobales bacterium]|nr:ABC transporter permease [Terriglobales bacterium]